MFDLEASKRIGEVFNRMLPFGRNAIANRSYAERVVWFVVIARCEKDMNGFASVFEQAFEPSEMESLIDGLRGLDENNLAAEFARGHELLKRHGFYDHRDLKRVAGAEELIAQMDENIGDQLWDLDVKMAALLDIEQAGSDPERDS